MERHIKRVAVLGSGIMGARIACHFANIGCEVLLLDIVPTALTDQEQKLGNNLTDKIVRNRIVNQSLTTALKSSPSPIYSSSFSNRITTGNFDDDLHRITDVDWIIEVVIERLDIKNQLFEKVEQFRKPGTIISSNTSGIPIHLMLDGRSEDFKHHFLGTHFFNPPRYLPLLELIPTAHTNPELLNFLKNYGSQFLGKKTIICKDTPAFIANRIGVYGIMQLFHVVKKFDLTIEEIDYLTGPIIGRPKSATFRTCDVVGLDTLVHVAKGLQAQCPNDEEKAQFILPDYIEKMVSQNLLGSKTKAGFYKKASGTSGEKTIQVLDLNSFEYRDQNKQLFPELAAAKSEENLAKRIRQLIEIKGKAGDFYRNIFGSLFAYVSNRIPEISEEVYAIDDAIKAGFGWDLGPFELWDIVGLEKGLELIKGAEKTPSNWISDLQSSTTQTFYQTESGSLLAYSPNTKNHIEVPGTKETLSLNRISSEKIIWKTADTTLSDLGDGIINLAFHTKMNTMGGGVIQGINQAIELAEKEYKGLVISNNGVDFSAGANVGLIFMMAIEQDYDELNFAIKSFQETMMHVRYSKIPVVVAPHNMALGGGCELSMHADKVVAHAELYMGLVEFGVGLIPGGGGSKEFAKRLSDELRAGDIKINRLRERFLTIGQAKVSTSAQEAFELGYLRNGIDEIVVSRELQLTRAKDAALQLSRKGYTPPTRSKNITVLGQEGLGIIYVGANSMVSGNYMSVHDQLISEKLGWVLCGGDLSENTLVSENYLLDMERKAFVELCMERKTLERMESLLKKGKILRN